MGLLRSLGALRNLVAPQPKGAPKTLGARTLPGLRNIWPEQFVVSMDKARDKAWARHGGHAWGGACDNFDWRRSSV